MILWSVLGFVLPFLFEVEEDEDEEDDPEPPLFPKDSWDCVRQRTLDSIVITPNLFMLTLE